MNWFDFFQAFSWCILVIVLVACLGCGIGYAVADDEGAEEYKPKLLRWFIILIPMSVLMISIVKGLGF